MTASLSVYFGHHKCASQWVRGIITGVCQELGLTLGVVNLQSLGSGDITHFVDQYRIDFLADMNARPHHLRQLNQRYPSAVRGVHIIRDPRDICVSAYFSHLYSHATQSKSTQHLVEVRQELQHLPKEEGLLTVMQGRQEQFEAMYGWDYTQPMIDEVKLETLMQAPYEGFLQIFAHLGLLDETEFTTAKQVASLAGALLRYSYQQASRPFAFLPSGAHKRAKGQRAGDGETLGRVYHHRLPLIPLYSRYSAAKLLALVYANRFSVKAQGRARGEEEIRSHYRKGVAGDWRNHFTERHIRYMKANYNELLVKLGYESGADW